MNYDRRDLTAEEISLVGKTFLVRHGRKAVPMEVRTHELGWCYCRSLDLKHSAKWPADAVRKEILRQRSQDE